MMTETTWMDSHQASTEGFVDGIVDMGSGIINAAADRTVVLKDAEAKVHLWLERSRRRMERRDKDAGELAAVVAVSELPAETVAAEPDPPEEPKLPEPAPEEPVTAPVEPGTPVAQLHKRLELIRPRH